MTSRHACVLVVILCGALAATSIAQTPVGTAFTYQGRLTDGGSPASGPYSFEFRLYDALNGGSQVGSTISVSNQPVSNGLFTVTLDFGTSVFTGQKRWLQIDVIDPIGNVPLSPRQELTATPYALYALNAPAIGSLWLLTGNAGTNPATNLLGTTDNQPLELRASNARVLRIEPGLGPIGEHVCNLIAGQRPTTTVRSSGPTRPTPTSPPPSPISS